jgi:outer membrane protein OmpA-like peptidoglycan-associated protein
MHKEIRSNIRRILPVVAILLTCVLTPEAFAQEQVVQTEYFNAQLFRPAPDGGEYLVTNDSSTLGHLDFSGGLFLNYAKNLVGVASASEMERDLLRAVLTSDWLGSVGLFNYLQVNASFPYHLYAFTNDTDGENNSSADYMGDLQLSAKATIFPRDLIGVGLAVLPFWTFPTGKDKEFLGDKGPSYGLAAIGDFDLEFMTVGVNMAYKAQQQIETPDQTIDDLLTYSAAANFPLPMMENLAIIGDLWGSTTWSDPFRKRAGNPLELDVAARYLLLPGVSVTAGAGRGITQGLGAPSYRIFAGIAYRTPESNDRDGDGLIDEDDSCPDQPEDHDMFEDEDGCPDPDNDNDSILDFDDDCPNEAETVNGVLDEDGCPEADTDQDGIVDDIDQCPEIPETFNEFEDEDGCPDTTASLIRGTVVDSASGDPVIATVKIAQTESEFVVDLASGAFEAELENPGTYTFLFKAHGYRDLTVEYVVEKGQVLDVVAQMQRRPEITLRKLMLDLAPIFFVSGKAKILEKSFATLDIVVGFMKNNAEIRMSIGGYTDSVGSAKLNMKLSQQRADSVKTYLVEQGIDEARIDSVGYGEEQPVATNATAAGRAKNRRVEFVIIMPPEK